MSTPNPFEVYKVKRAQAKKLPDPTKVIMTIHFVDHGQDFLEWDLNCDGYVVAVRPAQEWAWKGYKVYEPEKLRPGHPVRCYPVGRDGTSVIRYQVERIVTL